MGLARLTANAGPGFSFPQNPSQHPGQNSDQHSDQHPGQNSGSQYPGLQNIIGKSPKMVRLMDLIRRVSNVTANILIQGESGTGKEIVARTIHSLGNRRSASFLPINCAAIPEQLLESELFGHVRGSFTGATTEKKGLFVEADGGSLFLDEIGDLTPVLQTKLLRVLQDQQIRPVGGVHFTKVDVHILAATHRDLRSMIMEDKFREDLFYRLNVVPIQVPPLRERVEDIPVLVEYFIKKFAAKNGVRVERITPEALAHLIAYGWPGNVRELENVIERAVVLSQSAILGVDDIMGGLVEKARENFSQMHADMPTLDQLEERYIKSVLARVGDRKEEAARILGINRRTLYRKEKLYGLEPRDVPEV